MTFEEFRDLAMNPPMRDEETVFEVTEYDVLELPAHIRNHYPKFNVSHSRIGFGRTLTEAETIMKKAIMEAENSNTVIYCFHIKEFPLGQYLSVSSMGYGVSWRLYDTSGNILDKTYCSDLDRDWSTKFGRFCGRTEESIRFKGGDIVEVLYGDEVRLAVIDGSPLSVEGIWNQGVRRKKEFTGCAGEVRDLSYDELSYYDSSDDTVWIIFGPHYFDGDDDRVHVLDVMPLHYLLSKKLRDRYERWYKEMIEEKTGIESDELGE